MAKKTKKATTPKKKPAKAATKTAPKKPAPSPLTKDEPAPKKQLSLKDALEKGSTTPPMEKAVEAETGTSPKKERPATVKDAKVQELNEEVEYGPKLYHRYPAGTRAIVKSVPEDSEYAQMFPKCGNEIVQDGPGIWRLVNSVDIAKLEKLRKRNFLIMPENTILLISTVPLA